MKAVCCANVLREKEFAVKKVYCEKTIWTLQVQELIFAKGGSVCLQVLVDLRKRIDLVLKRSVIINKPETVVFVVIIRPKSVPEHY